jgi:hypothetical protein
MTAESPNSGARQWYGKHVTAAANKNTRIEDVVFSTWPLLSNLVVKRLSMAINKHAITEKPLEVVSSM